ncbi:MAG: hypothetical protein RQ847_05005 [Wenzhouxiangellaceae bacterium]|nr:hypothetical protein [Wenzhouxiangellaceae bacterium]
MNPSILVKAALLMTPLTAIVSPAPVAHAADECPDQLVSTETMRQVIASIEGYDTTLTTNYSRFVADFLFGLAAHPAVREESTSFRIQPEGFMSAWQSATGRSANEAPVSMQRVLEYGQHFAVDIRPDVVTEGPEHDLVMAVHVSWPESAGLGSSYTYEDTLSEPDVRIREQRVIEYLLFRLDDVVAYERITGVSGRPTSGALGALFTLLGVADIESTRHVVAADGTQVNRARVRKLFPFTALATIAPDGTAQRGIPDGREDLEMLAEKLDFDLEIEMRSPWPTPCH